MSVMNIYDNWMRDVGVCVQYLVWQIFGWISVIGHSAMRALSQHLVYIYQSQLHQGILAVLCKVVLGAADVVTCSMSVYTDAFIILSQQQGD